MQHNNMKIEKTEEIVEEVVENVAGTFCKRVSPGIYNGKSAGLCGDGPHGCLLVSQVLTNLLENTQRHANGFQADVVVTIQKKEGFAVFIVEDTGPGISERYNPKLFQFTSNKEAPMKILPGGWEWAVICKTIIQATSSGNQCTEPSGRRHQGDITLPLSKKCMGIRGR